MPEINHPLTQDCSTRWHRARRLLFWGGFSVIIGVGIFFRFWRITHQSYWCDEAATIRRVDGSFYWVLRTLMWQGFPPGWFVVLWGYVWLLIHWLHIPKGTALTSAYMRLVPAFVGSLLVPTAYFLARQFTNRRGALLIMLLVAVNPFLIYYSRDLKMYEAFYLLTTLHVALFLKWQGSARQWLWYSLWVITGVAMLMTDTLGCFMVGVELLWLIFQRRPRPWDMPLWCLGAGMMGVLPVWWYTYQSHWLFHHTQTAVPWVESYNVINWRTIVGLPCVHLLGFLWPVYPLTHRMIGWFSLAHDFNRHLASETMPWLAQTEFWIAVSVAVILASAMIPRWGLWKGTPDMPRGVGRWWHLALWIALPMTLFALASLPVHSRWSIYPHRVIWHQRYLGFIAMAWVLWLGLALARLPGRPLRYTVVAAVVLVCTAFSLTNQLLYRQVIWNPIEKVALHYFVPSRPKAMVLACTRRAHGINTMGFDWLSLRAIDPQRRPWQDFPLIRRLPNTPLPWIRTARWVNANKAVRTFVIAEDMPPRTSAPLETMAIPQALGANWHLVESTTVQWHYQWWFYFFTTWHIQVWQRVVQPPIPPPGHSRSAG